MGTAMLSVFNIFCIIPMEYPIIEYIKAFIPITVPNNISWTKPIAKPKNRPKYLPLNIEITTVRTKAVFGTMPSIARYGKIVVWKTVLIIINKANTNTINLIPQIHLI